MKVMDEGFIVIDTDTKEYFCGVKKFDKQIRKVKIFHSKKWADEVIETKSWRGAFDNSERNLVVKPIKLTVEVE